MAHPLDPLNGDEFRAVASILHRVFETPTNELFGDLIRGKHGGVVILASGNPGVGKTLTAEVYAEMSTRPLYVLEFGEMGTTVEQIESEENQQKLEEKVKTWLRTKIKEIEDARAQPVQN